MAKLRGKDSEPRAAETNLQKITTWLASPGPGSSVSLEISKNLGNYGPKLGLHQSSRKMASFMAYLRSASRTRTAGRGEDTHFCCESVRMLFFSGIQVQVNFDTYYVHRNQ